MNLPNKKEFLSYTKKQASNFRLEKRKLERQNERNQNGVNWDDFEQHKLEVYTFVGRLEATFEIMGWGEIPKMLTRNLEPNI